MVLSADMVQSKILQFQRFELNISKTDSAQKYKSVTANSLNTIRMVRENQAVFSVKEITALFFRRQCKQMVQLFSIFGNTWKGSATNFLRDRGGESRIV